MEELVRRYLDRRISRREFVTQLGALGFSAAAARTLLAQIETSAPIGEGKGIHPGRVVWVRDAAATAWDGTSGRWWDDSNTDQAVVDHMTSRTLQALTGQKSDKQAWDALFHHFNRTHGFGNVGYRPGEKIAVKINCNQDRTPEWGVGGRGGRPAGAAPPGGGAPSVASRGGGPPQGTPPGGGWAAGMPASGGRGGGFGGAQNGLPSPHATLALVSQLITMAGVPGADITIYEVAGGRNIGQPIYAKIRGHAGPDFQAVTFLVNTDLGLGGRIAPTVDTANPILFSKAGVPTAYLPQQVTAAKYHINLALLRSHFMAGVTLAGKNQFGAIHFPNNGGWTPSPLHNYVLRGNPMGSYNALVDLIGHRHLGGKTVLYVFDGLYTAEHNEGSVFRWASLNDDWASSILMSQDPVAIDSVGLDILKAEPNAGVQGNADNYLHEAAQAAQPPSGTVYDPNGTGKPLASLGVHEHWNNAKERRYSRNLGKKEGIELIAELG
jgi:hypothetical protein